MLGFEGSTNLTKCGGSLTTFWECRVLKEVGFGRIILVSGIPGPIIRVDRWKVYLFTTL